MACPAENIFEMMEIHLKNLKDGVTLSKADDRALRSLLDEYWNTKCPIDQPPCNRDICNLARIPTWAEDLRYINAGEILKKFKYDGVKVLRLNDLPAKSINMNSRRKGHYNP
jgi:hypothetical protein